VNEADCKLKLVKEIKLLGGYARRLEDKYALGLLDLIFKLPGRPIIWAEGKLINGHKFGPTPRQYVEGDDWIGAGALVLLIGWQNKAMYISPWVKQADKRLCWECSGLVTHAESLRTFLDHEYPNAKEN
jgi:hypothetical protein